VEEVAADVGWEAGEAIRAVVASALRVVACSFQVVISSAVAWVITVFSVEQEQVTSGADPLNSCKRPHLVHRNIMN
jgi:hypothetical protein